MAQEDYRKVIKTRVGAYGRTLTFNAKHEDGTVYNLTGVDTATLSARRRGKEGTLKIDAGSMTIVSPASSGVLTYKPLEANDELDAIGELDAMVELTDGNGDYDYPEPFIIDVEFVIRGSA